jgi:hypothetical protein
MASFFTRFLDHIQHNIKVGKTPLGKWSTCRLVLYLRTGKHSCSQRDSNPQSHQTSERTPRGHHDSPLVTYQHKSISSISKPVISYSFQRHRIKANSSNVLFVTMDSTDNSWSVYITFYCFFNVSESDPNSNLVCSIRTSFSMRFRSRSEQSCIVLTRTCMTVCLCMTTLTEVFPWFFLSCKANARVMPAKTGHGPHSS